MKTTVRNVHLSATSRACLWVQAGVVKTKICTMDYECRVCRFDAAMRRVCRENRRLSESGRVPAGRRGAIVFWKERLRRRPLGQRPCLHSMKGRIGFRVCTHNYHCGDCEFDQYFNDQYAVHVVVRPVDFLSVKGFSFPQGYYFHPGHTWAKVEADSTVRIGLNDFALRVFGPLDKITPALFGKAIRQGTPGIRVKRGDRTAAVLSPLSGVVTETNPRVMEDPLLANRSPYTDGWILRVRGDDLSGELGRLSLGNETWPFLAKAVETLEEMIEETAGPLAADGGYLGEDIFGNLPGMDWDRMTRVFLGIS